ncbi:hypothetical protein [Streptomyces sparsogenes]|uniref:Zinc-finger domain-containing protein n=1 Tax=Streptomyces sparsogenes DSM 40356 TaxID=1331668 RepID=A0A1R1SKH4_9ACTN|nr:hypothetical protein [Streptomyces sparsogenes]OMI38780.1 hypothetical protein SPAR_14149 [Streptomyces sparsogenes DSM 40356]
MTSSTDTDEHPEVTEISALTEGLLPPDRTAHVRDHLAACVLCADVRASLDEIRSLLGTLPGPVQMPADIAGRIDAALAAEALLDATAPDDRVDVSRETSALDAELEAPPSVSRETSKSAPVRKPLAEAEPTPAGTAERPAERPAGRPRAGTGPGRWKSRSDGRPDTRPGTRPGTRRNQPRRWPRTVLGAACAAAVIGLGSFLVQSGSTTHDSAGSDTQTTGKQSTSDAEALSAATLKARVHALLADQKRTTSSSDVNSQDTPDMPLRAEDPLVPSCVQAGTGRSDVPLAAQQDTYAGKDVYLVVLPHHADSELVDAFVIDSTCVKHSPSTAGDRLVSRTYPRH